MNTFGLGLILNFTDNASAGMQRATQTFNQMSSMADQLVRSSDSASLAIMSLSTTGMSLSMIGDQLSDMGNSIVSLYTGISQSIIDTGMTMQGFRGQLQALYGENSYEQKLQEIKKYAKDSVFEVEGLMSAVTMMKVVGIEAMDEVTSSSGKTTQKLLDYASDLAAMNKNMRNSYGTGVNAAMGALKEYIAEGNTMSLKRGAGLDITGILGEEKGATIEERTRQVADLIEVLGIAGYTASLVGTPTQQLAKIQDILFNAMSDISDSGVFDRYTQLLTKVATWVESLTSDTERYNAIIAIVGDTITSVLDPLESLLDYVIKVADAFIDWAVEHPELTKGILTTVAAIGALLVVGGQILKFSGSIFLITSSFMQMSLLAKTGTSVFKILGTGVSTFMAKAVPLIALAGLIYTAWSNNLFGIRDTVTKVFDDLGTIFSILRDAWSDNTLSEENFVKAQELGILPLIEGILQLKYYWDFLVEGFKTGFQDLFTGLSEFFGTFNIDITAIIASFGEFLDSLVKIGQEDKWTNIGEALGKIAGAILIVVGLIKPVMAIISVFTKIFSVVGKVVSFVGKLGAVFTKVGSVFSTIGSTVMSVLTAIAGFLGISVGWVVAIIAAVVALGVIIVKNWDKIKTFLAQVGPWIMSNIIIPVRNFFATMLNFIVGLVVTIWEAIVAFVTPIAEWIYANIIQPIVDFFVGLWNSIVEIVTNIWNGVVEIFTNIYNGIVDILTPVAEWVNTNIVEPVVDFFNGLWQGITGIVDGIYESIVQGFQDAYDFVVGLWEGVVGFFSGIWDSISGWVSGIVSKGESITGVASTVPAAATGVKNFVGGLIQVNEDGGELITLPSGSTVIPHDQSIRDSLEKGINIGAQSLAQYTSGLKMQPQSQAPTQNDYSVTFSAGSIVIQLANATDAELEKAADKLMKIIERKQQLKAMAVRA